MAADDMMLLREELAQLRRIVKGMGEMGRVKEVKKGRIRVVYGQGDVGDEDGKEGGVWIRTAHGGAQSEGRQWAVGETVATWAVGGNPEHCIVHPAGWNDKHPRDGNDTDDNGTRRWRKPPESSDGNGNGSDGGNQGSAQSGGSGTQSGGGSGQGAYGNEDKNEAPQWKDSEDDHQEINTHDKRNHKIGKYSYEATKDGGIMRHDKLYIKCVDGKVEIGSGDTPAFTFDGTQVKLSVPIVDKSGKKFAVQGSIDSRGDTLTSKFANDD